MEVGSNILNILPQLYILSEFQYPYSQNMLFLILLLLFHTTHIPQTTPPLLLMEKSKANKLFFECFNFWYLSQSVSGVKEYCPVEKCDICSYYWWPSGKLLVKRLYILCGKKIDPRFLPVDKNLQISWMLVLRHWKNKIMFDVLSKTGRQMALLSNVQNMNQTV